MKLQHSFFTGFRLHCIILNTNNSVETLSINMKTILLCAASLTKSNQIKNPRVKKDQTEVNICSDGLIEEILKPQHCSFLKLHWLPSGQLMSNLMEFHPKRLLCQSCLLARAFTCLYRTGWHRKTVREAFRETEGATVFSPVDIISLLAKTLGFIIELNFGAWS